MLTTATVITNPGYKPRLQFPLHVIRLGHPGTILTIGKPDDMGKCEVNYADPDRQSACRFTQDLKSVRALLDMGRWLEVAVTPKADIVHPEHLNTPAGDTRPYEGPKYQPPVAAVVETVGDVSVRTEFAHDSLPALKMAWKETIHGDGGDCPVCSRWGKVYDRTINETMAAGLKWLYDQAMAPGADPRAWINCPVSMPKELVRSNQFSTLRWWGLIERCMPDEKDKKRKHSGMWRITLKGMDFVEGKLQVPERVFTYDGEVVSFGSDMTYFANCKGGFDYSKVMGTTHVGLGKSLFPANDDHAMAA